VRNHIALTLDFGRAGNAHAYQLDGWSGSEPGFTWAIDESSALRLPRPIAQNGAVFEIKCAPFTAPPVLDTQRLIVLADGVEIAAHRLRSGGSLAWWLPPIAPGEGDLLVTLRHPDAARPREICDSAEARRISWMVASVRIIVLDEPLSMPVVRTSALRLGSGGDPFAEAAALTGMPIADLVTSFEALTGNCEFGFFQRRCGADPLSLLRFAAGRVSLVLQGIDTGFEGIGLPEDLQPRLSPGGFEWMIEETRYGLVYHTFTSPQDVSREEMFPREATRLQFLARKFMEDATEGHKIFVCKDQTGMLLPEVLPLVLALNRHGPCTVLWVTAADGPDQAGRVDAIAPRLLRGYLDRLSPPDNPGDFSLAGWLNVCVNAVLLYRQNNKIAP
jgi:hypothetical protein